MKTRNRYAVELLITPDENLLGFEPWWLRVGGCLTLRDGKEHLAKNRANLAQEHAVDAARLSLGRIVDVDGVEKYRTGIN